MTEEEVKKYDPILRILAQSDANAAAIAVLTDILEDVVPGISQKLINGLEKLAQVEDAESEITQYADALRRVAHMIPSEQ